MTLDGSVLRPDSLKAASDGATIAVRLAWYRSLPLSCITRLDVSVDGTTVPSERMRLELNGKTFAVQEFAQHHDEWWFIQDPGMVHIQTTPPIEEGRQVEVSVVLDQRIPYILIGPQTVLPTTTTVTKQLTAGPQLAEATR